MTLCWEGMQGNEQRLEELMEQVQRVRSWGGAYSEIELSPYVKALINQQSHAQAPAAVGACV